MGFIKDHILWFHRDVDCLSISANHSDERNMKKVMSVYSISKNYQYNSFVVKLTRVAMVRQPPGQR